MRLEDAWVCSRFLFYKITSCSNWFLVFSRRFHPARNKTLLIEDPKMKLFLCLSSGLLSILLQKAKVNMFFMDDLVQDLKKWKLSECKIHLNGGTAVVGQPWGLNWIPFWRLGFGKRSGQRPAYTPRSVIWLSSHSREKLLKPCCWEKNVNVIYKGKNDLQRIKQTTHWRPSLF